MTTSLSVWAVTSPTQSAALAREFHTPPRVSNTLLYVTSHNERSSHLSWVNGPGKTNGEPIPSLMNQPSSLAVSAIICPQNNPCSSPDKPADSYQ